MKLPSLDGDPSAEDRSAESDRCRKKPRKGRDPYNDPEGCDHDDDDHDHHAAPPVIEYLKIPMTLAWDGMRPDGRYLDPGTYTYTLTATLLREPITPPGAGHGPDPVLAVSEPFEGTVTLVLPRPDPPTVDPVPSLTSDRILALSGTKPADTGILIDDVETVALSSETTWSTTVTLIEGANLLEVATIDDRGFSSAPLRLTVTLDTVPPPAPEVEPIPSVQSSTTVTLSGVKEAGSAIWIDGAEVVPASDATTWEVTWILAEDSQELQITAVDAAGNESVVLGSDQAEVVQAKPVIGELTVTPGEAHPGESPAIAYRLFARVPPAENADLAVTVRVLDGSQVVRTLLDRQVQAGDPTGPAYSLTWDLTDETGAAVAVNRSYRVEVSAERVAPSSEPAERIHPNSKDAVVLVLGSARVASDDGALELIYRPEAVTVAMDPAPVLSSRALRRLVGRGFKPIGSGYQIRSSGPTSGSVLAVWTLPASLGPSCRPALWDEAARDWVFVVDADWDGSRGRLSFELPGTGVLVPVSGADSEAPRIVATSWSGGECVIDVEDPGTGIDLTRLCLRLGSEEVTGRAVVEARPGGRRARIRVKTRGGQRERADVYLVDHAGNGRLHSRRGP